jgi:hypothetical protein
MGNRFPALRSIFLRRARDVSHAANVLNGPVSKLRHLVGLLARANQSCRSGRVTAGRSRPGEFGETWSTALNGIALDGIRLHSSRSAADCSGEGWAKARLSHCYYL